jgi:hypothetical protein
MESDKLIAKIYEHLFSPKETQVEIFTNQELLILERYKAAITKWYDDPLMKEEDIRNFLLNNFDIKKTQAYQDIPILKYLFGNVRQTSKEFYRMRANRMVEDAYQELNDAETNLEVNKAQAKIKAALVYAKINKLEKEDFFAPRWDDIAIPDYTPTSDVSIIKGLKPIPNLEEKKRKLRIELGLAREIEDIQFEEMSK